MILAIDCGNTNTVFALYSFKNGIKQECCWRINNNSKRTADSYFPWLLQMLTLSNIKIDNDFIHPYQNASIMINGKSVGCIYKIHPNVAKDFDISNDTCIAQIDFDLLSDDIIIATNISKFQASKRDLSIVAPKSLEYKEIK